MVDVNMIRKAAHWLLIIMTIAYVISGIGIRYYQTVELVTFGLLSKSLAFRVHAAMLPLFLILLAVHMYPKFWGELGVLLNKKSK